jgi:hypothetical protein
MKSLPATDSLEPVASAGGSSASPARVATEAWARARGITPPAHLRWHVEIAFDTSNGRPPSEFDETTATRFQLDIYSEEWGVFFCHQGRSSWIRTADAVFVHGRDEFQLLAIVPPLEDIGRLLRHVEQQQRIAFQRQHAAIRTNLPNAELAIRAWVLSL